MTSLYLLLLVAQTFALKHTLPESFGGKTDFSNRGWKALIGHLSREVKLGPAPRRELSIEEKPTCSKQVSKCSTSYFEKHLALKKPESGKLWVKWHQDATPFACDSSGGCIVSSVRSVVDLTSQSKGWSVTASLNAQVGINNEILTVKGKARTTLSLQDSEAAITSKTMTSTKMLSSTCLQYHMCYIQTGTLMMTVSGICDSEPVIICDRPYFPCIEFNYPEANMCSQWDMFTLKYCKRGSSKPDKERCSINVGVSDDNGAPISFQVFEQKPMPYMGPFVKRDEVSAESPFDELPDCSSGTWMAWSPQVQ